MTAAVVVLERFSDGGEELRARVTAFARESVACEPGCLRYDVLEDENGGLSTLAVFTDAEALEAHDTGPRRRAFEEALGGLGISRTRDVWRPLVHPEKPGRILAAVPILAGRRELLGPLVEAGFDVVFNETGRMLDERTLIRMLPGVVATIAGMEPYTEAVFHAAPQLRVIARLGVGYDTVDVDAATRHGVAVAMAFGTNHEAVAEHAFALVAALAQRLFDYDRRVREGGWGTLLHPGLYGRTLGIVGFGRIGRAMAKRAHGFGLRVLVADPQVDAQMVRHLGCELVDLDTLFAQSDYISLHAPLTPETRHLVNRERLARVKSGSVLVNTARGGLVDEAALVEALESGRLAGAGLDVFEEEPLPEESPLRRMDRVILTPHVAGLSEDALERMTRACVDNILTLLRGEVPGEGRLLNPRALARAFARTEI